MKNFTAAGYTLGGPLWSTATMSHLHSVPETQKMILTASETTEEEEKQSNGEMFSLCYSHASFIIYES
jgi:hypothetical protein